MTEKHKVYEISTINDILEIPSDKLDEFFEGFVKHIKLIKSQRDLVELYMGEYEDIKNMLLLNKVIWTDDGDPSHRVTVTLKEEQ